MIKKIIYRNSISQRKDKSKILTFLSFDAVAKILKLEGLQARPLTSPKINHYSVFTFLRLRFIANAIKHGTIS